MSNHIVNQDKMAHIENWIMILVIMDNIKLGIKLKFCVWLGLWGVWQDWSGQAVTIVGISGTQAQVNEARLGVGKIKWGI